MSDTQERTAVLIDLDTAARIRLRDPAARGADIRYVADLCLAVAFPALLRVGELRADGVLVWSALDRLATDASPVPAADAPDEVTFRRIGDRDGSVGFLAVTILGLPMPQGRIPVITARPAPRR
ncbi:hypothetical protein WDZ11_00275 (plasmid) [Roseomonas mucosa]|uniref:hypothetical protein n=1 Tax=Roseomonas mucosa TaxID=207340 RepID=UPI0030CB6BE5